MYTFDGEINVTTTPVSRYINKTEYLNFFFNLKNEFCVNSRKRQPFVLSAALISH